MPLVISIFEQGLIYAVMALGMYITYKILDFPDMTVDGSFPFGAAITAVLISKGFNPYLTLPVCFMAGAFVGMITGIIHVKLKVRDLLAGIIMMTALYTVNLRITGKASFPIYTYDNIFNNKFMNKIFTGELKQYKAVIIILIIVVIAKLLLDLYMKTKSGYLLKAVGDNETIVTSMGIDKGKIKILGLAIANGLVTMSGCMYVQQMRSFDVSMGTGTAVIGLASVIIGTSIFKNMKFIKVTTSVIIGSVIYKACVATAIHMGLKSSDLKLITAVLFLVILVLSMDRKKKAKGLSRGKTK